MTNTLVSPCIFATMIGLYLVSLDPTALGTDGTQLDVPKVDGFDDPSQTNQAYVREQWNALLDAGDFHRSHLRQYMSTDRSSRQLISATKVNSPQTPTQTPATTTIKTMTASGTATTTRGTTKATVRARAAYWVQVARL